MGNSLNKTWGERKSANKGKTLVAVIFCELTALTPN